MLLLPFRYEKYFGLCGSRDFQMPGSTYVCASTTYNSKVSGAVPYFLAKTAKAPLNRETRLETDDGFRLQTLGSFLHLELHSLTLVQGLVTLGLDRAVVYENVLTALTLNEPIALAGVKPLDSTLFSTQLLTPCWLKLFALVVASRVHKKRLPRASPLAA